MVRRRQRIILPAAAVVVLVIAICGGLLAYTFDYPDSWENLLPGSRCEVPLLISRQDP
ncbi:MAG: hypothetical protein GXX09_00250 [Syntrophomonadaceae bacterium]|nr:hypothetical protein [Syntrophomonadaceae bacterium]